MKKINPAALTALMAVQAKIKTAMENRGKPGGLIDKEVATAEAGRFVVQYGDDVIAALQGVRYAGV